jgi:hypothetical protein
LDVIVRTSLSPFLGKPDFREIRFSRRTYLAIEPGEGSTTAEILVPFWSAALVASLPLFVLVPIAVVGSARRRRMDMPGFAVTPLASGPRLSTHHASGVSPRIE